MTTRQKAASWAALIFLLATAWLASAGQVWAQEPEDPAMGLIGYHQKFSISAQSMSADYQYNVRHFFAWKSGTIGTDQNFSGQVKVAAGETFDVNAYFGPYTEAQKMKLAPAIGDGVCNAGSMLRQTAVEAGLKASLSVPAQQGHIINGVQYPIPGVKSEYWTVVYSPGQNIILANPYEFDVWINWRVNDGTLTLWVSRIGPAFAPLYGGWGWQVVIAVLLLLAVGLVAPKSLMAIGGFILGGVKGLFLMIPMWILKKLPWYVEVVLISVLAFACILCSTIGLAFLGGIKEVEPELLAVSRFSLAYWRPTLDAQQLIELQGTGNLSSLTYWNGGKVRFDPPQEVLLAVSRAHEKYKNESWASAACPYAVLAVAHSESPTFQNTVCSSAGACGVWQFMPGTWVMYSNQPQSARHNVDLAADAAYRMICQDLKLQKETTQNGWVVNFNGADGSRCWNCSTPANRDALAEKQAAYAWGLYQTLLQHRGGEMAK